MRLFLAINFQLQWEIFISNTIGFLGLKQYQLHRNGNFNMTTRSGGENGEIILKSKFGEVWGTPSGQKRALSKTWVMGLK